MNMSVVEYVNKMRSHADEMAAVGRVLEEEQIVEYILAGLGIEYDPIVSAVIARPTSILISELYSQLLAYETRQVLMNNEGGSSINSANQGRSGHNIGGFSHGGGRDSSTGGGRGAFGRGFRGSCGIPSCGGNNSTDKQPMFQVCKKKGHTVDRCCHRYDEE
jgi:hypothetical protein